VEGTYVYGQTLQSLPPSNEVFYPGDVIASDGVVDVGSGDGIELYFPHL
jgi:hypothetical protein